MVGKPLPTSFGARADPKVVQRVLGHATAAMTMDLYGNPRGRQSVAGFGFHAPVAVAAATLAAAALFHPLRVRVQRAVDRRFNRARYDADQTVAAFAARLKDAVDLDWIQDDLAGVVHQSLEPSHVSVWVTAATEAALPAPPHHRARCAASPSPSRLPRLQRGRPGHEVRR